MFEQEKPQEILEKSCQLQEHTLPYIHYRMCEGFHVLCFTAKVAWCRMYLYGAYFGVTLCVCKSLQKDSP